MAVFKSLSQYKKNFKLEASNGIVSNKMIASYL